MIKAQIKKFGTIYEDESGALVFTGFNIDAVGIYQRTDMAILNLVIKILRKELAELEQDETRDAG